MRISKKIIQVIIFTIFSTNLICQNLRDSLDHKQGVWIYESKLDDTLTHQKIIIKCIFINDTINGLLQKYDSTETLRFEVIVKKGKKEGIGKSYDSEGKLVELTSFIDDECRERIYLTTKKSLYKVEQFNNRLLDGYVIFYHENGKIRKISPYTQGKLNGTEVIYGKNGKVKYTYEYLDDKLKSIK